jgi:hypothetical protein
MVLLSSFVLLAAAACGKPVVSAEGESTDRGHRLVLTPVERNDVSEGVPWRFRTELVGDSLCGTFTSDPPTISPRERVAKDDHGCTDASFATPITLMGRATLESAHYAYVWGFTTRPVQRVRFKYAGGRASELETTGGTFVLVGAPGRQLQEVTALDGAGGTVFTCAVDMSGEGSDGC